MLALIPTSDIRSVLACPGTVGSKISSVTYGEPGKEKMVFTHSPIATVFALVNA